MNLFTNKMSGDGRAGEEKEVAEVESSICLVVDKVYFGSFKAYCSTVKLFSECMVIKKCTVHTDDKKKRMFDIKVPFSETEGVKMTHEYDNQNHRYLFVTVEAKPANQIAAALEFDSKQFNFDDGIGSLKRRVAIYFKAKNAEDGGSLSEFFALNYKRNNRKGLEFVSLEVGEREYQKSVALYDKSLKQSRQSGLQGSKRKNFPSRAEFQRAEKNGRSDEMITIKSRKSLNPTESFYSTKKSLPLKIISEGSDNEIRFSSSPSSSIASPRTSFARSIRRNGRLSAPEVIDLCDNVSETSSQLSKEVNTDSKRMLRSLADKPVLEYITKEKDCINIYNSDIECLKPGEFLNDTILSFYLGYLHSNADPELAGRVHIFSPFFYKKLITPSKNENPVLPMAERVHARVNKWTKSLDIFSKDFLVIPMNQSYHWFLAIVYFPKIDQDSPKAHIVYLDSLHQRDEKSLMSDSRILRHYLQQEWRIKRNSTSDLECLRYGPQVPQQPNSSDCGVYLLHYVEELFKDPAKLLHNLEERDHRDWFSGSQVRTKRMFIKNIIDDMERKQKNGSNGVSSCDNDELKQEDDPFCSNSQDLLTDDESNEQPMEHVEDDINVVTMKGM
ncbi:Sentrin-specific protease 7 [Halotydeus destructor]|nr:Sentrin-specific protease 7 [Halotydeus destructor]